MNAGQGYSYFHSKSVLAVLTAALAFQALAPNAQAQGDFSFVAQSVLIPRTTIEPPATDLFLANGTPVDRDALVTRIKKGEDISLLEPQVSDVWNPQVSPRPITYPSPGADGLIHLKFDSLLESPGGLMRARVATDDAANVPYRIVMTWNLHPALMNAELLRRTGYTVDLPRRYAEAEVRFDDVAARDAFINDIARGTRSEPERWLVKMPEPKDLIIRIRDFALEPGRIATPTYYWGAVPVETLQGRRALRALLIPLVLTGVPDSINLWTWEAGRIFNDAVALYHPYAGSFEETTIDDARWMARRIANLTEEDLRAVVRAGGYPASIEPLLVEKLKSRRNHLMKLVKLKAKELPVQENLSYDDPETGLKLVDKGKLLRKQFAGYGFDFIGADPDSPLRRDELFRFFRLAGIGSALTSGLNALNSKLLQIRKGSDLKQKDLGDWITANGLIGGFRVSAARKVVTGTYYGSDAPVQLVDKVSVGANLGYFLGAKPDQSAQLAKLAFSVAPNVGITRTYLHTKAVTSMEEALKTPWKELAVLPKMRSLAKILDAKTDAEAKAGLVKFLDTFLPDESFTVIDSIDLGLDAKAKIPVGFAAATVGVSGGWDGIVLRRTVIQRTTDGRFQVSLQRIKKSALDFGLSGDMIIEIIKGQMAVNHAGADSQVFVIDPAGLQATAADPDAAMADDGKKLMAALMPLLRANDSSAVEKGYSGFSIDHTLGGNEKSAKLLLWKWLSYHEEHRLKALPQVDRLAPGVTRDSALRDLFSIRDVKLSGSDSFGFGTILGGEAVNHLIPGVDVALEFGSSDSPNPSSSFLGKAHIREVRTEAELTPGRDARSLIQLQETYQGWSMPQKKLFSILDKMEKGFSELAPAGPMIRRAEFQSTEKLILFQISATLLLSEKGIDPIWDMARASADADAFYFNLVNGKRVVNFVKKADWVKELYKRLRAIPAGPSAPGDTSHARGLHDFGKFAYDKLKIPEIIPLVGQNNSFFQIRVTGFRTKDENGDSEYLSDSIGLFDPDVGTGAFREFAAETGISVYETYGQYLGIGL